jgi:RND family efflux transporter MFP subunit
VLVFAQKRSWSKSILAGGLILALLGCGEEPAPEEPSVRAVKILEMGAGGQQETREYPGQISAAQTANLAFEVPGKIVELPVKEGQAVAAGDVIARLDPRDYEAKRNAGAAREKAARADYDRARALFDKEVISKQQLDTAQRNYEVAKADADTSRKSVEDTLLRAPFAGKIARKLVDDFKNVQAKEPIVTLQDDSHLEIVVNAPESDFARVKPGQTLEQRTARSVEAQPVIFVSSLPDRAFPARLKELATTADPITRTYAVTFSFENPTDVSVFPGMTARVRINRAAEGGEDGFWLPTQAVRTDATGEAFVWVIEREGMTAKRTPVTLGVLADDRVRILSGLQAGDWVAVSGVHQLREGVQVRRYEQP